MKSISRIGVLLIALGFSTAARAALKMELVDSSSRASTFPWVDWGVRSFPIVDNKLSSGVRITGKLAASVQQVMLDGASLSIESDRRFRIVLKPVSKERAFVLKVRLKGGKSHERRFVLKLLEDPEPESLAAAGSSSSQGGDSDRESRRWHPFVGLGITRLDYVQTAVSPFKETLLTLKAGVEIPLSSPGWSLGAGAFYNALELANSGVYQLKVLGANLRLGKRFSRPESRNGFRLNGGLYYNTSISDIGFKNMLGPQIYPEFLLRFSRLQSAAFYLKYSPVITTGGVDLIRNRELAMGLSFRQVLKNGNSVIAGLDYAELDVFAGGEVAHTRTLSFGVGLGF